jgi:hypothetical protein
LKWAIREDIYKQYIPVIWVAPFKGLGLKLDFFLEHLIEMKDGLIV